LKCEEKRLPDEAVTVPAGEFIICSPIQVVIHGTDV